MDVRLIDTWRNVTTVPAKGPPFDNAAATLDGLLEHQDIAGGQLEIVCDREFLDALGAEMPDAPWKLGHSATYKGVPVIVPEQQP